MNRFVIMTVGKTHSGKTTFAHKLEEETTHSVIIDQDNHAQFLKDYYPALFHQKGPNKIKYTLTQTMVDYVVNETNYHIILCNSNYNKLGRERLLTYYKEHGFTTILVFFDLPDEVLYKRVENSGRNMDILRTAKSFLEVLDRQRSDMEKEEICAPTEVEADYLFTIQTEKDVQEVVNHLVASFGDR